MSTAPPPFAAEPNALKQAQQNEQNRRCDADLAVGGEDADEEGAESHDDDRHCEHGLTAKGIAEMPENRGAQGSCEIADAERAEGCNGAQGRVGRRKEQLGEDQSARRAIDQKIVPLHRGADDARNDDFLHLRLPNSQQFAPPRACSAVLIATPASCADAGSSTLFPCSAERQWKTFPKGLSTFD
jgi:hypothetical protein